MKTGIDKLRDEVSRRIQDLKNRPMSRPEFISVCRELVAWQDYFERRNREKKGQP